jgi:carbon-monoxide dehydrogenase small subunit
MSAKALLDENPSPDDGEIREALSGTFCRCTGHIKTVEAVKKASEFYGEGESNGPEK